VAGIESPAVEWPQADLKTCAALGVYAATAITALTAQNTHGVAHVHASPVRSIINRNPTTRAGVRWHDLCFSMYQDRAAPAGNGFVRQPINPSARQLCDRRWTA
jgi:Phosphomethylpyrimidine kinase